MTAGRFVEDLVTQYLRVTVPQSLEVIMSAGDFRVVLPPVYTENPDALWRNVVE